MRPKLLLVGPLAVLLLAGCVPTATVEPSATDSPSAIVTPAATPSPTPIDVPSGVPVAVSCDELVSPQVMYDFNPNFGLIDDFEPSAGSLAAAAVAQNGVACRWVNQTSGETIDVAVANLPDELLATTRSAAGTAVTDFASEGYFDVVDGDGVAQAFSTTFWISAVSSAFFEAGDVAPLIDSAIAALG